MHAMWERRRQRARQILRLLPSLRTREAQRTVIESLASLAMREHDEMVTRAAHGVAYYNCTSNRDVAELEPVVEPGCRACGDPLTCDTEREWALCEWH